MMEQTSRPKKLLRDEVDPIEIKNLSVTYRTEPALWNIDLAFPKGKMIAIVGPNGAGKSSLMRTISTLQEQTKKY